MAVSGAIKLLDFTAVTATQTSNDWELPEGALGAIFVLRLPTVTPGATGATLLIYGKDELTGTYYELNATPTAVNATGTFVYVIFPGAGTTPGAGSGLTAITDTCPIPPKGHVVFSRTDGTFTGTVSMTILMPG